MLKASDDSDQHATVLSTGSQLPQSISSLTNVIIKHDSFY